MRKLLAAAVLLASCSSDPRDMPSLVVAAREGDAPAVREIVKRGADPNARYGPLHWTPLMHAIYRNQPAAVGALLDAGADVNRTFNFESEPRTMQREVTPLMMASAYGHAPIVQMLLRRGAESSRADSDGNRALDYALSGALYRATLFQCQDDVVRALVVARAPRAINADTRRWAGIKRCKGLALLQ